MKYRYKISIDDGTRMGIYPYFSEQATINQDRYEEAEFFRPSLSEPFEFIGEAYTYIYNADIESTFLLETQKLDETTGIWSDSYQAEFFKTNCEFDEDAQSVKVTLNVIDQYTKILEGINREYNLLDLPVQRDTVQYNFVPQLQFYRWNAVNKQPYLVNINGTVYTEVPVLDLDTLTAGILVNDYFFSLIGQGPYVYVSADISVTIAYPDVVGRYDWVNSTTWTQAGGSNSLFFTGGSNYEIQGPGGPPSGFKYKGADTTGINGSDAILDSDPAGSQVEIFFFSLYSRFLVPENYLSVSQVRNELDIVPYSANYPFVYEYAYDELNFLYQESPSATPTDWKRRDGPRINIPTNQEYFTKPPSPGGGVAVYPFNQSSWLTFSIWFGIDAPTITIQENGSVTKTIKDAYLLQSVVSAMLGVLDTDLTFLPDVDHSDFYFNAANPIDGTSRHYLYIPKSNVLVGEYDQPASVAKIRFGEFLLDLWQIHRVRWDITPDGKFRLEHIRFYRNGGSYTAPVVGIDIANYNDPYTDLPWSTDQNKFSYIKENLAKRIESNWHDKNVSFQFGGLPIEILSRHVDESKTDVESMTIVTTDIDYSVQYPGKIAEDSGLFMVCCNDIAGPVYVVAYKVVDVNGIDFNLQNGELSFPYLQPTFFRDNMPAPNVNINGGDTTALTTIRVKQQTAQFASGDTINPQELMTTQLGTGQIEALSENLTSTEKDVTINLDTE